MQTTIDRITQLLTTPDPLIAWLVHHQADEAIGLNASVEHSMVAYFLREQLHLPKRSIKTYPHKTEIIGGQYRIVLHPAWLGTPLQVMARALPPLTILRAGDMLRVMTAVRGHWADRVRRHYWGSLRSPDGFYE